MDCSTPGCMLSVTASSLLFGSKKICHPTSAPYWLIVQLWDSDINFPGLDFHICKIIIPNLGGEGQCMNQ